MRRVLLFGIFAGLCLQPSYATTVGVYFNQADWEAAMSLNGTNALTPVSFDSSQWTSSLQTTPGSTSMVNQSTTAAADGMSLSFVSGYSAPGIADDSTLGHVSDGMWTDTLSKYGSTTLNFSTPVYGFGGTFDITGGNGLFISPAGELPYPQVSGDTSPYPSYDGFIGIITDQPLSSVFISWGDNGSCYPCFSNSYTLSDFEVATVPTPEPNFNYLIGGLVLFATCYAISRR